MKNLGILLLCLCWLGANATSWRVNNNPAINADFSTFQEAHDAASPGDTIYMEGSTISYGAAVLQKPLVIIGPGFFLLENDSTQANFIGAEFGFFTIDSTASGSQIYGCVFYSPSNPRGVRINGSNIIFSRNYLIGTSEIFVGHGNNVINTVISHNYIGRDIKGGYYSYDPVAYNTIIFNNYVGRDIKFNHSTASCVILNNVFRTTMDVKNSIIKNNIHVVGGMGSSGFVENTGNLFEYNLTTRSTVPPGTGNQSGIDPNTVFIDYDGSQGYSTDGKWQLNPEGPAAGAGENDIDCGMFGGVTPYVLSGLAPIPRIYEADVPISGSAATGLPVTIKVKSQN